jgi:hypothetical protein
VVVDEFLVKGRRHYPLLLMLHDEADKIVDVAELLVDAAVPLPDAGKDAFRDAAEYHCTDRKGERNAASGFQHKYCPLKGGQKLICMVKNRVDQKN